MHDPRLDKLAGLLVNHSTRLTRGEHLLVEAFDAPEEMVVALVRAVRRVGGHPHVAVRNTRILRALDEDSEDAALEVRADYDRHRMAKMDAYVGLRNFRNISEMAGIPAEQMQRVARLYQGPVHFQQRINHTRWCVLRWPSASMAQLAGLSTEAFEDFYFDVCTLDYGRMQTAAEALAGCMASADRVHIEGPGDTDLRFSIKSIPAIPCTGSHNIPDGECFTAPVRDSVNGVIHFNTPTIYNGITFENVRLVFENGRIVEATAEQDSDKLDPIFDTDEGGRYVGEFAIGFNPYILEPMKDILFDEKIAGSIHFTPGRAYDDADNGNRSEIHWDLVLIQRPDYGGGTLTFDDTIIRRDGIFETAELKALNPDALKV